MKIQYPLFKNNDEILNYIKKENLNYFKPLENKISKYEYRANKQCDGCRFVIDIK